MRISIEHKIYALNRRLRAVQAKCLIVGQQYTESPRKCLGETIEDLSAALEEIKEIANLIDNIGLNAFQAQQ